MASGNQAAGRRRLAEGAADLTATGVGVALSTFTPVGALATPFLKAGFDEVIHRTLTKKQEGRVNLVASETQRILNRLFAEGARLRTDDFFKDRDGRWSSQEVTEAVLLAASNEPMELKIPYLGHLLAVVAVTPDLDVQTSHWLLKTAEDLTWTQYIQLAIVARLEQLRVPDIEASPAAVESWTAKNAMLQFEDLGPVHRELIAPERGGDRIPLLVGRIAEYRLRRNGPLVSWALGLDEMQTELLQEHLDFIGRAARAKT